MAACRAPSTRWCVESLPVVWSLSWALPPALSPRRDASSDCNFFVIASCTCCISCKIWGGHVHQNPPKAHNISVHTTYQYRAFHTYLHRVL